MFKLIFLAIQDRLMSGDPLGLKHYDWYNNQERNADQAHAYQTPAVLIEFLPWNPESNYDRLQTGMLSFRIYVVQERFTDKRHDNPSQAAALAHLDLVDQVFDRLQRWAANHTDGNGVEWRLMNSIRRTRLDTDHRANSRFVTRMTFQSFVCDFTRSPKYTPHALPSSIIVNVEQC